MSDNKNIYSKAIPLTIAIAVVILVGTVITMAMPLMRDDMHPKLDTLKMYSALELEGRNIYQREGCVNCHSQVVRPLTADVVRYGEYTKAGESYYEHPFLWGSKRTGPDIARLAGKYSDQWHIAHLKNPQQFVPQSNMPIYAFLDRPANAKEAEASMKTLKFPYTASDIDNVKKSTELIALTAYLQSLGSAIAQPLYVQVDKEKYRNEPNPMSKVSDRAKLLFSAECASCHSADGKGTEITGNKSFKDMALAKYHTDGAFFADIANGIPYFMPSFVGIMSKKDIWELVIYVRELADNSKDTASVKKDLNN